MTIQAASKAGYETLSLNHAAIFTEALRLLLKRDTLAVTFSRPSNRSEE